MGTVVVVLNNGMDRPENDGFVGTQQSKESTALNLVGDKVIFHSVRLYSGKWKADVSHHNRSPPLFWNESSKGADIGHLPGRTLSSTRPFEVLLRNLGPRIDSSSVSLFARARTHGFHHGGRGALIAFKIP